MKNASRSTKQKKTKNASRSTKQNKLRSQGKRLQKSDIKALALIRASGVLNPDTKLDEIFSVAEKLGIEGKVARGTVFIYEGFIYDPCPPVIVLVAPPDEFVFDG